MTKSTKTMNIITIDHIGIRVTDFQKSLHFYQQFGFISIREDYQEHVFVMRHPSGITINLLDNADNNFDHNNVLMDIESRYPGYTHYAIAVKSISEMVTFLQSINCKITEGPVTFGNGQTSVFIRDPDMNVIEFTEHP